jgi:hypothetical protein
MYKNFTKYSIYKYTSSNKKLTFTKKKNNFIVTEGIFNYQINKKDLSCPCSNLLCSHIIFFLTDVIKINIHDIVFYGKFKNLLITLLNENIDFKIINQKINDFIDEEFECLICFCNLRNSKFNNNIVECSNCYNYCHKYCFDLYKSKNTLLTNICIHCKSGDMS